MKHEPSEEALTRMPHPDRVRGQPWRDIVIHEHFFLPNWHWYAAAYDPQHRMFYAYAILRNELDRASWCDASYDDLRSIDTLGMQVTRDRWWWPRRAEEVKQIVAAHRRQGLA